MLLIQRRLFLLLNQVNKEILDLTIISYTIGVVVVLSFTFVLFFIAFQKRKNKLLLEKMQQQKKFDEELVKTQQEIQDETFKQIGRELHDNVGQLLALASMHLKMASASASENGRKKIDNAAESLKTCLAEVRSLSKSLNSDVISNSSFKDILTNEVERLNKIGNIKVALKINGEQSSLNTSQDKVMLFRIIQEFLSNSIKYSDATQIKIALKYVKNELIIEANDNGKGFKLLDIKKGSGLINMEKRAGLINSGFQLESKPKEGTFMRIVYPFDL